VSSSEIARAFRIPDRNWFSSPLIVKFTIIARCNKLIAGARQKDGLMSAAPGRSIGSLSANELQSERRTFSEARRLAAAHSVGRV